MKVIKEKFFISLANERIIATDINNGNVILTSDGIKIIAYDKYRKNLEKEIYMIFSINNDKLLYVFKKNILCSF